MSSNPLTQADRIELAMLADVDRIEATDDLGQLQSSLDNICDLMEWASDYYTNFLQEIDDDMEAIWPGISKGANHDS